MSLAPLMSHTRQVLLLKAHGWPQPRGAHRDKGWFTAVSEAAPNYLSVELPASVWPTGSRTRKETLTEVEMAHWPLAWISTERNRPNAGNG